jgi:hypothetical protein
MGLPVRLTPSFAQVDVASAPRAADAPDLLPADPRLACTAVAPPRPEGLIEIMLPSGVTLRVDTQVDHGALRPVLGVLDRR